MTRTELRKRAKEILLESIAVAYYRLSDGCEDGLSDEEVEQVIELVNQYGKTMAKSIGETYYTM